jgi:isochorismate synthase
VRPGTDSQSYVGFAMPAEAGALLRLGPEALSLAWANPSRGVHAVGLGVAGEGEGEVEWVGGPPASPPPGPWFGGWAFDAERPWRGFDAERWVLPEVLAWWDGRRAWWAAFGPQGTREGALRERLRAVHEVQPFTGVRSARRSDEGREAWHRLVEQALADIGAKKFDKLVVARVIELEATRPLPERAILKALEARHPQCWTFLVRGRDGRAFIGSSPETLCEVSGGVLLTEALAGTSAAGQGANLLGSAKDRREHAAVVEGIGEALAPFTAHLEVPTAPSVMALSNLDHLHTPMRALLKQGVVPVEVARALHPTPAVAGRPRLASVDWLRRHEGFARGWYTGAVGHRGSGRLTLAVGLRAALVDGARAQLFVGAGLVEGSTPEGEWHETERKARALLPVLGVEEGTDPVQDRRGSEPLVQGSARWLRP